MSSIEINIYNSIGDGLRANPDLEDIDESKLILGMGSSFSCTRGDAKDLAEARAQKMPLVESHIAGINFFTQKRGDIISTQANNLWIYSTALAALGHIGRYRDFARAIDLRKEKVEKVRGLIAEMDWLSQEYLDYLNARLKKLVTG